jgi:hypothetical protein
MNEVPNRTLSRREWLQMLLRSGLVSFAGAVVLADVACC